MRLLKYILIIPLVIFLSCNKGISPEPEIQEPGFNGVVTFLGEWPDSVTQTHIVLFKDPLLIPDDFNAFNLFFVSDSIPYGAQIFNYNTSKNKLLPPGNIKSGEYSYLAVAQSISPALSLNRKDWFVVGVYYAAGDTTVPGKLVIPENTFIDNINITCDFDNPPPQPPGG